MRRLTSTEAASLRAIRLATKSVAILAAAVSTNINVACEHDGGKKGCPVCALWSEWRSIVDRLDEFGPRFDKVLMDGPEPKEPGK